MLVTFVSILLVLNIIKRLLHTLFSLLCETTVQEMGNFLIRSQDPHLFCWWRCADGAYLTAWGKMLEGVSVEWSCVSR